jgi:hypothetical protein
MDSKTPLGACPERKDEIPRGVYAEQNNEILRGYAPQNDKERRAQNDKRGVRGDKKVDF